MLSSSGLQEELVDKGLNSRQSRFPKVCQMVQLRYFIEEYFTEELPCLWILTLVEVMTTQIGFMRLIGEPVYVVGNALRGYVALYFCGTEASFNERCRIA
ncbi:hypothetical protein VNO77_35720 [Canavalia gladiata]|uniref:Uncharacterized protein n=1 Tax=Canavalia gladiata TaxID=3824 RepID=A0AAN9K8Y4_CANGL